MCANAGCGFRNFANLEEDYRLALHGSGDWLISEPLESVDMDTICAGAKANWDREQSFMRPRDLVDSELHGYLLIWLSAPACESEDQDKAASAGLRNIRIRGNSRMRHPSAQSMACLKGMGRRIAG